MVLVPLHTTIWIFNTDCRNLQGMVLEWSLTTYISLQTSWNSVHLGSKAERCNLQTGTSAQKSWWLWYDVIYLLTANGLAAGGSSTLHIYTQTIHLTTQNKQYIEQQKIWEECAPCPVFASYTLAFALQLRKKHGKTSVRVAADCQLARWKQNIQNRTHITIRIHKHKNKNT
jgi:hypothetical protein